MPKVQPIYDTRERACAPRESTPIQNERPRGAAGILGEEEQQRAAQTDKKPPTPYYLPCRRICQAQSGANEPPHHKQVRTDGAKVLLDLREGALGLAQTGGRLTSSHPCRCEDLRKNHEKAVERKEHRHPHEWQLEAGFFPSKRRLGPKVFHLGAEKTRPSKRRRNYVEKAALRELRAGVGAG